MHVVRSSCPFLFSEIHIKYRIWEGGEGCIQNVILVLIRKEVSKAESVVGKQSPKNDKERFEEGPLTEVTTSVSVGLLPFPALSRHRYIKIAAWLMSMVYSGKRIFWFDRKEAELAKINHLASCFPCHWYLSSGEFGGVL